MQNIYTLGETVYDIIFSGEKIESACVGGSVVNTSVSLARVGLPVFLISQFANDRIGKLINEFLDKNMIKDDFIYKYSDAKTPLAIAFLNENRDAQYEFYKEKAKENLQISLPDFKIDDVLLFGSFFSINTDLRKDILKIIIEAKSKGTLIIYDPNFRNPNKPDLEKLIENVNQNISIANIIRGSKDDFQNIYNIKSGSEVYKIIDDKSKILIYTDAGNSVEFFFGDDYLLMPISKLNPFSTIGAGDNFNAGLIFGLMKLNINLDNLNQISTMQIKQILNYGIKFAQNVCMSFDNYISNDFAEKIK